MNVRAHHDCAMQSVTLSVFIKAMSQHQGFSFVRQHETVSRFESHKICCAGFLKVRQLAAIQSHLPLSFDCYRTARHGRKIESILPAKYGVHSLLILIAPEFCEHSRGRLCYRCFYTFLASDYYKNPSSTQNTASISPHRFYEPRARARHSRR